MLKETKVNGAIHEGQWQVLDQLIEKCMHRYSAYQIDISPRMLIDCYPVTTPELSMESPVPLLDNALS